MAISYRLTGITIGTTEGATGIINIGSWSGASFQLTTSGPTTLTWYERIVEGGSFLPAKREGEAVTQTVDNLATYEVPFSLNGSMELKAVATAGEAGVMALVVKESGGIA